LKPVRQQYFGFRGLKFTITPELIAQFNGNWGINKNIGLPNFFRTIIFSVILIDYF